MSATGSSTVPNRADTADLLRRLGVADAMLATGNLVARSPINGVEIARLPAASRGDVEQAVSAAQAAFLAWRSVPAPRRGELVRLFGEALRAHKAELGRLVIDRGRQDPPGRPRRSAGDDRHLRFRRRPVAPALRPHHRDRAARPSHDGDVASARRGRHHQRLQFSRRRLGVERRARAGLRRHASCGSHRRRRRSPRSRMPGAARSRAIANPRRRRLASPPSSSARRAVGRGAGRRSTGCRSCRAPPARRAWAAPWRRASPQRFGRALLELGGNNAHDRRAVGRSRSRHRAVSFRRRRHRGPALHHAAPPDRA